MVKVGIVGTGYAAKRRAESFVADSRAQLVFVAGNSLKQTQDFCDSFGGAALASWLKLVNQTNLDLVVISTINRDHAAIARAALEAGKHVVVEYPLALSADEGALLLALAQRQNKLLHVEHIELLGGLHQAVRAHLTEIGSPFYVCYKTLIGKRPAPRRWTFNQELFGFPMIAALSRVHRFTNLFGAVDTVSCQSRFWDVNTAGDFKSCLCLAQLVFKNGVIADLTYGKGERIWQEHRSLELQGELGAVVFDGQEGNIVRGEDISPITVASRRGLFVKDTAYVLDYLLENRPLYVQPEDSLYALKVADAARQSAKTGKTIQVSSI